MPGRIVSIDDSAVGMPMARVSFAGIVKEVCLARTPEASIGDYVVVHVGFAIARIDETEAQRVFAYLESMDELGEPCRSRSEP